MVTRWPRIHRSQAYLTPLIKTIFVEQSIIGKSYKGISNQDKEPSLIRIVELSQATVDIQTWGKNNKFGGPRPNPKLSNQSIFSDLWKLHRSGES